MTHRRELRKGRGSRPPTGQAADPRTMGSVDVSRETDSVRIAAFQLFGPNLARAEQYAEILATVGVERGLIGPREVPRLWERHLLNSGILAPLFATGRSVIDVGSGAGLPGIPLGLARPDLSVTLLEPQLRRTTFLDEVVDLLDLRNVTVVRARAEDYSSKGTADYVVARAVAPLARLVKWCAPLLRPGGELIAVKGASAEDDLAAARDVIEHVGARNVRVVDVGTPVFTPPTRIVQMVVDRPYGLISKRASSQGRRRERKR
jgi:16S rRNA (guanine527-N7)-methyltransferase